MKPRELMPLLGNQTTTVDTQERNAISFRDMFVMAFCCSPSDEEIKAKQVEIINLHARAALHGKSQEEINDILAKFSHEELVGYLILDKRWEDFDNVPVSGYPIWDSSTSTPLQRFDLLQGALIGTCLSGLIAFSGLASILGVCNPAHIVTEAGVRIGHGLLIGGGAGMVGCPTAYKTIECSAERLVGFNNSFFDSVSSRLTIVASIGAELMFEANKRPNPNVGQLNSSPSTHSTS